MLKITPGTIESDGHVVLLPAGLTGEITTEDGAVYDLGPASQVVIEVDSHEHAMEVATAASQLAHDEQALPDIEFDPKLTAKNFAAATDSSKEK